MFAANAFGMPSSGWFGAIGTAGTGCACSVSLVDRRTGQTPRIGGSLLRVFTRDPQAAAAKLLAGRDPQIWEARVQPLESVGAQK